MAPLAIGSDVWVVVEALAAAVAAAAAIVVAAVAVVELHARRKPHAVPPSARGATLGPPPGPPRAPSTALAQRVRATRAANGVSQEELAARSGTHRTYIGAIERGERNPTFKCLVSIAAALGIPLRDLLDGGDGPARAG